MIALAWDGSTLSGDLQLGPFGLAGDDSLVTAVLVSLFTDRRALTDDPLPAGAGSDRRGWAGDALSQVAGDRIGSRLWLLKREKQTEETRRRAEDYVREALAWLAEEGLAAGVVVSLEWQGIGLLAGTVEIRLPSGAVQALPLTIAAGVL
ncbi:Mu-like prophage protein gp46 [Tistlia consotensis]|uniref:Mu-like prophage protein gp46 n=1 Tax=Tistlia consotensis USBA 355 TaxID=560819 RepID=A0A1Y6CMD2_9PROT|nr:phage GP46 family protein [Tistlia consotensis]SMF77472.1 Mu-like prophage protein gp46 [Tistlia consotensis USBA 355]SMF83835.1 Mu-like prophage protein gp46 [Tistlia consotensis USBA 355]SNS34629.1 Mu-like prophage protein gp46 [Tistlia consotensis]